MSQRLLSIFAILVVSSAILIFTGVVAPLQRVFLTAPRCESAQFPEEIFNAWQKQKLHGRTAIVFTRRLNGEAVGKESESTMKYLEESLQQGIIRTAYHYVPDESWNEVSNVLTKWNAGDSEKGFTLMYGGGRMRVLPLSRFVTIGEKALVVVAPAEWSSAGNETILNLVRTRKLATDYLFVLRGSASYPQLYNDAFKSQDEH